MRRAARTDGNHRELLDLARRLGGFVIDCRSLGCGAPDAFVAIKGQRWIAVEIKTPRGKLTAAQQTLHVQAPIVIWRAREDVYAAFGVLVV
jgi:hypothetical protein